MELEKMSDGETKGAKIDSLQIRLTPRIHDLISGRKAAHHSTMKQEIEELIVKGTQLEQLLQPKGRLALDVMLSLLNDDMPGAVRKLLEGGMGIGRVLSAVRKYQIDSGLEPIPEFRDAV